MRRDLCMTLILGCLLILLLEAPAALSSVTEEFQKPYEAVRGRGEWRAEEWGRTASAAESTRPPADEAQPQAARDERAARDSHGTPRAGS